MHKHLLIDADDTLWENNIYFEQATEDFISFLQHSSLSSIQIRAILHEIERGTGYGSANFARNLQIAYKQLAERDVAPQDLQKIEGFAEQITHHPIQLLPSVRETLTYLSSRHDLILLTKGDQAEQQLKIDNSELASYFHHILIVPEKNVRTYTDVVERLELDVSSTWMIGNSPHSDINPALAAGLRAVYIPHPHTWELEQEEIAMHMPERLLILHSFADLRLHF